MYGSKNVIKRDKSPDEALETARWLCSKMERSADDVRRSLYRWGVREREVQDQIVETLRREQFIDHERYASSYVRSKMSAGKWGASKIVQALKLKGVESEIIAAAMEQNSSRDDLLENLERDMRKHFQREKDKAKSSYDLRVKLFRRAASRGFDLDDINTVLGKMLSYE